MLRHLQRHEVGHRSAAACRCTRPSLACVRAVAARIGEDADEVVAGVADGGRRPCTTPVVPNERRRRAVGDRLRQRAEHDVEDPADDFEIAADRRRIFGREHDVPSGIVNVVGAERAAVDRHFGKDVLHRDIAARQRRVARRGSSGRATRRRVPVKSKCSSVPFDGERQRELHRLVDDAVIVEEVLEASRCRRGSRRCRSASAARSASIISSMQSLERLAAVARRPARRGRAGRRRTRWTSPTGRRRSGRGRRTLARNIVTSALVEPAVVVELDRRDDHALLVDFLRLRRPAARARCRRCPSSGRCSRAARTARRRRNSGATSCDVLQMRAAEVGIVEDPHVARLEAALRLARA